MSRQSVASGSEGFDGAGCGASSEERDLCPGEEEEEEEVREGRGRGRGSGRGRR